MQQDQRPGPIDGLGDRRHLAQLKSAQRLHEGDQLAVQPRLDPGHSRGDDPLFQPRVRQRDVQVKAAALQGVAEVADIVGGQEHQRRHLGLDGADLRHGHLERRQDLQQEGLEGLVALVDFVDQQHRAAGLPQGLQQRARLQEGLGEEQVAHAVQPVHGRFHGGGAFQALAHPVLQDLGVEQLFAVLPLVQRLALVEALVALHADQRQVEQGRGAERQLGLADPGHAFHQDRLLQVLGHEQRGGDAARGDVAHVGQAFDDRIHRGEGRAGDLARGQLNGQSSRTFKWAVRPQLARQDQDNASGLPGLPAEGNLCRRRHAGSGRRSLGFRQRPTRAKRAA